MKVFILAAAGLLAGGAAFATHSRLQDANQTSVRQPLTDIQVQAVLQAELDAVATDPMAIAVFPGPLGQHDIDLYMLNLRGAKITEVILDVFRTKNRRSLLIQSCWGMTSDVFPHYPLSSEGMGPMILGFDAFQFAQTRSVGMDPDTYPSMSYGATVREMGGSLFQVVFEDGARGIGRMGVTDLGNVAAFVYPTFLPKANDLKAAPLRARR